MADRKESACADCGRPMVEQREWRRNPRIRPGRARAAGYGRCQACYMRGRRHGTLPVVTISSYSYHPVQCDQCGPVAEAVSRPQATRLRDEHLQRVHGVRLGPPRPLSDAELARLRRSVGLAS